MLGYISLQQSWVYLN